MKIVVVGGGMQGRVIAENLLARPEKPQIVIADIAKPNDLPDKVLFQQLDVLNETQVKSTIKDVSAIVLAVPSKISHQALSNLIATGSPIVDVSFTADPPLDLNAQAKNAKTCCVVDCGIAPGLTHMLTASAHTQLGGLDSVAVLTGGLPQNPPSAFKHAIYFNAQDLIAEYVRPARARKNGKDINPYPMQAPIELYNDVELGPLEAFATDGLRSLLDSYKDVPNMVEYTLRWPGHIDVMRLLYEIGLFNSQSTIEAIGSALTHEYPCNNFSDVMLMVVEARRGKEQRLWRLIDRSCNGQSAMSRTTGYTTAATAMLLARKQFTEPGVHPPERIGQDVKLVDTIVEDLAQHGIAISTSLSAPFASSFATAR